MTDHPLPYGRPTDPGKRHSHLLTDGPDRAGARAMLKAIGFTDDDLAKPIVGVATTWIETMPCNFNQRRLAEFVKEGIRAAGGTPMEFNTDRGERRRVDGHRGHEGVSLVSAARSSRTPSSSSPAATCSTASCASSAATRRSRRPRWPSAGSTCPACPLQRHDLSRHVQGSATQTVVSGLEAIGAYRAGKITLDELYEIENAACPGPGACGGQYTANTMATVMEFIGLSPAGLNGIPAEDPARTRRRAGRASSR